MEMNEFGNNKKKISEFKTKHKERILEKLNLWTKLI